MVKGFLAVPVYCEHCGHIVVVGLTEVPVPTDQFERQRQQHIIDYGHDVWLNPPPEKPQYQ